MKRDDFPKDFLWGAATAAFQIEGAASEDGRGESIWDRFCAKPGKVRDGDTGAVACDHYHRFRDDVNLLGELGVNAYRFSLSWPRLLPRGKGALNPAGADFYDRLVDALLERGIEPSATLYHWDLPQALQDEGGWAARDTAARFRDYADLAFARYGDRIRRWYTHNEPWVVAFAGNLQGRHAPGIADLGTAVAVSHHLLLSHAMAVQAFRTSAGGGEIGIVLNLYPVVPVSASIADTEAADLCDAYQNRWFLDPLFRGSYPVALRERFEAAGADLPAESGDASFIRNQRIDFLGVNYYFRKVVRAASSDAADRGTVPHPALPFEEVAVDGARRTAMGWEVYAPGLSQLLLRLKNDYGDPKLLVTENGAAFADATPAPAGEAYAVEDEDRRSFLEAHFVEALRALRSGVRLAGYYVWSFLDNFEWAQGYSKRFGLFRVDYGTLERSWKKSGRWYQRFLVGR